MTADNNEALSILGTINPGLTLQRDAPPCTSNLTRPDTMSEPSALSVILEPLSLIASGIASVHWSWWFSQLGRLFILPWKIVAVPLSFVFNILLVIFAPVLHILSYILSWFNAVLAFIASLEPLYTFFGAAAAVGILAGLILGVFSSVITSQLGMQDDPRDEMSRRPKKGYIEDDVSTHDDSSANEADWQWLEPSTSRRRPASGLLSQTIHEEDDDSETAF